jgi:uncharacterized Zn-finger protein
MTLEEVIQTLEVKISELSLVKKLLSKYAPEIEKPTSLTSPDDIQSPPSDPPPMEKPAIMSSSKKLVLDYIAAHPGCRSSEIAAACNLSVSGVGFHLTALKKLGYIKMVGNRTHGITWAPAGKLSSSTETPPPSAPRRMQSGRPYPELKFSCEACRSKFLTQKQLTAHNQTFHEGKTAGAAKHPCTVCGKVFKDPGELEDHIDLRHPEYSEE